MRKSINFIVGLFFFVFVFSFFSLESKAADLSYNSGSRTHELVDRNISISRVTGVPVSIPELDNLDTGSFYNINLKGTFTVNLSRNNVSLGSLYSTLNLGDLSISIVNSTVAQSGYTLTFNIDQEFIYQAVDNLSLTLDNVFTFSSTSAPDITYDFVINANLVTVTKLSDQFYQAGYNKAMSEIGSWGADTQEYPIKIYHYDFPDGLIRFDLVNDGYATYKEVNGNNFYKFTYNASFLGSEVIPNFINSINPNHIYKIVLNDYNEQNSLREHNLILDIGSKSFRIGESHGSSDFFDIYFFSNGYDLGSYLSFRIEGIGYFENEIGDTLNVNMSSLEIYDYGPIGDTQNQIANQTNDLTNGYDSSVGESTSNTFSDNATSYEQAEANIFTSAKSDLNNFQFYDIGSDSNVLVGLSFVASTMTSIFNAMGGLSGGAGIVLSVLFSVILVSIVIGTYRYFVSSGKTGSSGSKKGGKG